MGRKQVVVVRRQGGSLSAILTAFNVPAYALLNPTPPDPSIALLQQISNKLDSFSISYPFVNSTQPSSTNSPNAGIAPPVPRWAVWLNGLWFSGLVLSLTAASMGLMSKQWLNEYSSGVSETSRHAARLRQYRLENLKVWHVEAIVNTIPVLLQLSLVCFLAGLLILLWNLHNTVAVIVSTLVGLLAIFTIAVTLVPLWNPKCAWISPQTRALYHIWQPKRFTYWIFATLATFSCRTTSNPQNALPHGSPTWTSRLRSRFDKWKGPHGTWQGRERSCINDLKGALDVQTLGEAYRITLNPDTLSSVTVCLMTLEESSDVVDCFRLLHTSAREHFAPATDDPVPNEIWGQQQMLWLRIILCVYLAPHDSLPLDSGEADALRAYFDSGSWSSNMQAADQAEWAASTLDALINYLEPDGEGTRRVMQIVDQGRLQDQMKTLFGNAIDQRKPLTNVVLRGESILYVGVFCVLIPSPDKPFWERIARFASIRSTSQWCFRTMRRLLTRVTCKVSTTSWSALILPRHHPSVPRSWRPFALTRGTFSPS